MIRHSFTSLFIASIIAGCSEAEAPRTTGFGVTPPGDPAVGVLLDQGLTPGLRQSWYRLSQGSRLIPYSWFLALEQPGNDRPFRADEVIERFGYIPQEYATANPDGLPVGFTKGEDERKVAWLGFTCAACHTSEIRHQGTRFRVDGAPGMADLVPFRDELIAAVRATLADPAKFDRFAAKALGAGSGQAFRKDAFKKDVQSYLDETVVLADRSRPEHPAGPSRVDAFSILINEMIGTVPGLPENYRKPAAPVSYPFLWGAADLEWVQWNGAVQDAIARNVGEVLIVFGHAEATAQGDKVAIRSTAQVKNLHDLEDWTKAITPPRWPEAILGAIDRPLAARGEAVYLREGCATCHANKPPYPRSEPNQHGRTFVKVAKTPIAELGTDPLAAANFADRTAKTGKFAPMFGGQAEVPAFAMFFANLLTMTESDLDAAGLTPAQKLEYSGFRVDVLPRREDLLVYKSGPLAGIWATAPFLHNGSVPNLDQLFRPARDRAKTFHVGSREFDPVTVGYRSTPSPATFEFRTEVPGNSNAGHEYGTRIGDDDRHALVEYLKTL